MSSASKNPKRLFYALSVLVMVGALALAQSPPAQTPTPVFKAKVEVVQLDVSVLDKHRQPVRGLSQRDFTVLEDGKPQPIVGFSTFDIDTAQPPATGWMKDVAPDVATNEFHETRLFVIVMDDAMIPQQPAFIRDAKKTATQIIERLSPTDLAAIVFTGDNRKTQDFTSDKKKLFASLENFNPGLAGYRFGADSSGLDIDMHFFMSSVRTLSEVADYLIAVPNRRKVVFWISPGVPFDAEDTKPQAATKPTAGSTGPPASMALDMRDLGERTELIFRKAQLGNVTINPIDPTGLGGMRAFIEQKLPSNDIRLPELLKVDPNIDPLEFETRRTRLVTRKTSALQDFLAEAAAQTGGRAVMNTNDWTNGIDEAFEENASYYLIGFEPTNTKADGTLRRLEVKVNRPDVEVRTRSSYYAPAPPKPDKKADKNPVAPETVALQKAMSGILPLAGMPMRAAVAAFAVPGQRLSTVAIVLGITQPIPAAAATARITETTDLLTSAFTPEGDARGAEKHQAKVVLRAGSNGEASYEVLARIDLPPGRYTLRLAAHNGTSGRDGSVFTDVTVPDYSNVPFSASPVVLGASPGRQSAPKDLLTPLLPFVPTAEREFAHMDKLTSFMRLYQSGQKPIEPVKLTIRVRDRADALKVDETQSIGIERFAGIDRADATATPTPTGSRGAIITPGQPQLRGLPTPTPTAADQFANMALRTADVKFEVPIKSFDPGPYLLTFEATLAATTIRRDVRFSVK